MPCIRYVGSGWRIGPRLYVHVRAARSRQATRCLQNAGVVAGLPSEHKVAFRWRRCAGIAKEKYLWRLTGHGVPSYRKGLGCSEKRVGAIYGSERRTPYYERRALNNHPKIAAGAFSGPRAVSARDLARVLKNCTECCLVYQVCALEIRFFPSQWQRQFFRRAGQRERGIQQIISRRELHDLSPRDEGKVLEMHVLVAGQVGK